MPPVLRSLAAGLPVVALAAMGTVDILAPGRGCIVPPDDPAAFGDRLGHYFNQPERWAGLREEARAYAEEWSDGAMAGLYRELMGRGAVGGAGVRAASHA